MKIGWVREIYLYKAVHRDDVLGCLEKFVGFHRNELWPRHGGAHNTVVESLVVATHYWDTCTFEGSSGEMA